MNPLNQMCARSLQTVLNALPALDRMGCAVTSVRLGGRNPVLHVDREPEGVVSAWCSQERRGRTVVREMVALVEGCEVRWDEVLSAPVLPLRRVS
jgi:hypothetical protein